MSPVTPDDDKADVTDERKNNRESGRVTLGEWGC